LYDAGLMLWKEFDRPGATRAFRVVKPDELSSDGCDVDQGAVLKAAG
jgi:hypothetical protein